EFFNGADSVVFFCSGGAGHLVNNHVPFFDKVMRTGAGIACLHYGVEVPIGPSGKGMMAWMGGYFEKNWSVNPHWIAEFEVFPGHEAANGVKPFKADDEWYFHMRFQENMKGVTPILSAVAPDATMKRPDGPHSGNPTVRKAVAAKDPQHVAWVYQRDEDYKNGRGFGFTGLHYHWNWEDDNFRKTVLNGVAWTLKLPIPENGVESKRPTKAELEANAIKHGGQQKGMPAEKKAAVPANPNLKPLFESEVINEKTPGHAVEIDIALPANSKELYLAVSDDGGYAFDWADWCEPRLVMADGSEKKLTDLKWRSATTGWGKVRVNQNAGGGPLKVAGKSVAFGIGVHSNSLLSYDLPKGVKRFKARGGIDNGGSDQGGESSVRFHVFDQNPGAALARIPPSSARPSSDRKPDEALDSLKVHPELKAQLFASEPMILSPSAIDVDARGRVWVCEVVNYRRHKGKRPEGDRIVILEDTNGDAKADKSTVFYQGTDIDSAHGICVLGNRIIISAGDDVFSLYDRNGDDKADKGSKELMFTKISGAQHDHGIHAFHFGPDGRLYFNFGNAGKALHDAEGKIVIDKAGNEVRAGNLPYQEGMVFRCELDGSGVETLGWNFRNNWEACVDSFGTIWQSDNDDDGNKGVRINYVMEYGNYGYKDEKTRAGWRDPRPNLETEVPLRHWHLNDPGVVPNLIQTGAGSPTGICVYEGNLLPEIFHGQPIHCDAGPNVVRTYVTKNDGAGYSAEMVNILENTTDRWFRPSDVCVAPDGSLIVADWYDPGVGGHGMGDLERGRIYRVTVPGKESYKRADFPPAFESGNGSARYLHWRMATEQGERMRPTLSSTLRNPIYPTHLRARALWLLARLDAREATNALDNANPNLRIVALRAIRQLYPDMALDACAKLANDRDPQVRREVAIALRFNDSLRANRIWATLAQNLEPGDRWGLEALGIGADLHWDARWAAFEDINSEPPASYHHISWRARDSKAGWRTANYLEGNSPKPDALKHLRKLSFIDQEQRTEAYRRIFLTASSDAAIFAAGQIGPNQIQTIEGGQARLDSLLGPIRGKAAFVELAAKLNLRGFGNELVEYIIANPNRPEAVTAARLLLSDRGSVFPILRGNDSAQAEAIATAFGKTGERSATSLLAGELKRREVSPSIKLSIVRALAISSQGGRELLNLAQKDQLSDALKPVAALSLSQSADGGIRNAAAKALPVPTAQGVENLPPMVELVQMKGNSANGASAYSKAACMTCHKVNGQFIDFGPDLSEIGNKLSKEAMFEAILYPSAAISHGFHGVALTTKSGQAFSGYITGETNTEVTLRLPGGVSQAFPANALEKREELEQSLMPPGLAAALTTQELVDLVAFLQSLKG
ncbi:MAG: PVC-type heme-binding CxxCH protein, partial [Verrucomicrobiota bacterium]